MADYNNDAWDDAIEIPSPRFQSLEAQGRQRYVPAVIEKPSALTPAEQGLLSQAVTAVGHLIANRQMSHLARSEDTAITHAMGSLIYSIPYVAVVGLITSGLMLFALILFGGDERVYMVLGMIIWGTISLHYLTRNREVGLKHSATGIALADIESREEIAKFVIEKHIDLIKDSWRSKGN